MWLIFICMTWIFCKKIVPSLLFPAAVRPQTFWYGPGRVAGQGPFTQCVKKHPIWQRMASLTCVATREENKKAWKSGLQLWNSNRRGGICYWCICLLSVCCPSVVRPLSVECLFVVYRMSVCCLFVVRLLSVCYPSIVCGPCVVRPLSVCCLSVVRALCVCGHWPVRGSVWQYPTSERNRIRNFSRYQMFSDVESNTFFDTKFQYFFDTESKTIQKMEKIRNWNVTLWSVVRLLSLRCPSVVCCPLGKGEIGYIG